MADTAALVGLAMSLKNFNMSHLYTQTVPVVAAPSDPNRSVWADNADEVWSKMREGKSLFESTETNATSTDSTTTDGTTESQNTDENSGEQAQSTETPDATTGLITRADGTLIDPNTGGTVDPEDGSIHDATTGQYIGIADRYLNATVCAVPAKN